MKELTGSSIYKVSLSKDSYMIAFSTDKGIFTYEAVGDCCANAYFTDIEVDEFKSILCLEVIEVDSQTTTSEQDDESIDCEFITIKTSKGSAHLTLRTEHNGYYCGWASLIDKDIGLCNVLAEEVLS
jgi:hypothetical protein